MNRISGALLLLGLGSGLLIFLLTPPEVEDPLLDERFTNKKYLREMRMLGGQGNVFAAEFNEWFAGLWHGRELGGTVAALTIGTVLIFRFVASHPGAEPQPDAGPPKETP